MASNKVELSNKNGQPISNVGELKEILEPFIDSCEITGLHVFYRPTTDDFKGSAKLEIKLSSSNAREAMSNGS